MATALPAHAHDAEPPPADCADVFKFVGAPGDVFRLILVSDPFLDAQLAVRDSGGGLIAEELCDGGAAPGPWPSCVIELDLEPLAALQIDLYDVEVSDQGGDELGAYQLQLEILPTRQPADPIIDEETLSFEDFKVLETPTDMDQLLFDGVALQEVSVEVIGFDVGVDPRVEIFAPDGSLLDSAWCSGGDLPGTACTTSASVVVPSDGVYGYGISDEGHDDFGNQGGRYTAIFRRVPEPSTGLLVPAALGALALVVLLARRLRARIAASSTGS